MAPKSLNNNNRFWNRLMVATRGQQDARRARLLKPTTKAYSQRLIPASTVTAAPDLDALKIERLPQLKAIAPSKVYKPSQRPANIHKHKPQQVSPTVKSASRSQASPTNQSSDTSETVTSITNTRSKRIPLQEVPALQATPDKPNDHRQKLYGFPSGTLFWNERYTRQVPIYTERVYEARDYVMG